MSAMIVVMIIWDSSNYCMQAHASSGSLCFEHIVDSPVFHLLVKIASDMLLKNCDWKLGNQVFRLRLLCNFGIC